MGPPRLPHRRTTRIAAVSVSLTFAPLARRGGCPQYVELVRATTSGLGDRFVDAVGAAIASACRWPTGGTPLIHDDRGDVVERKVATAGFPCALRYRVDETQLIVMAAYRAGVWSCHRMCLLAKFTDAGAPKSSMCQPTPPNTRCGASRRVRRWMGAPGEARFCCVVLRLERTPAGNNGGSARTQAVATASGLNRYRARRWLTRWRSATQ